MIFLDTTREPDAIRSGKVIQSVHNIMVESGKLGKKGLVGVGNPGVPHLLIETLLLGAQTCGVGHVLQRFSVHTSSLVAPVFTPSPNTE